ncbi:uncharacterized protein LOC129728864 [Wyeomyia smithii]|uniref:uncharacterized protein LOC129728864 n=1 Tax=Wyeomyia smithii TaxID=174621 RepID=UPI002467BEE4|nr:uncharacterized protein LOC129728864 [Wyeomyia smithii]
MPSTTSSNSKKSPALKTLQTKLKSYLHMFKDIGEFAQAFSVETTASQVTVRLEKLEELWEKVNDVIIEIEIHEDFTAEDETYIQQRSEFGNEYYKVKSVLLDKLKELEAINASLRANDTTQQPTVEHGCLAGEAKALIDPLSITRANYQIAWDTITKRYNDSKFLKRRQVQALFELPSLTRESSAELQALLEGFEQVVQTLDQLIQPVDYKDMLLLDILSTRLDNATRRAWEGYSSTKENDTVKDLTEFLQRRVRVLGALHTKPTETKAEFSRQFRKVLNPPRHSHNVTQNTTEKCVACSESHLLYQCSAFQRLTVSVRDKLIRTHSLCRNCFKRGHRALDCPSKYVCRTCKERHHTLVCFRAESNHAAKERVGKDSGTTKEASTSVTQVSANVSGHRISSVLLATAVVLVEDDQGFRFPARALLDSGSECNFMTVGLAQKMKLKCRRFDVAVCGIGESTSRVKQTTNTTIKSRVSEFSRRMEFLLLPKVTANLPTTNVNLAGWKIPTGVELANPAFFVSKAVDLVLGIQHFFAFFNTGNEVRLGENLPMLTEPVLGWVVSGAVDNFQHSSVTSCNMAVEGALAKIGESRDIAFRRLLGLERRLLKDTELRQQYDQFMEEYLQLGHMRKVETRSLEQVTRCYLPHHPVVKQESTTTKVRVVFDASCKTATGVSLNDVLLTGPVVQEDLRSIILRSRTKQLMLVSDVEKMFRQIEINAADRPLQSIRWHTDSSKNAETYELTTVTYGTRPAPFLATRTFKQLAMDEQTHFPLAARAVEQDVYMDDVLTGVDNEETALNLGMQLEEMLEKGGFRLRKWASNCPSALQGMSEDNLALIKTEGYQLDPDPAVRTLVLIWHPNTDVLKFRFKIPDLIKGETLTKRKVLSTIATLFDPLGLIGAVITTAKVFMQLLWCLKDEKDNRLGWDHPLPMKVQGDWRYFHGQLLSLNELVISRCVIRPKAVSVKLHVFSDASERAYGACAYVRSIDTGGNVSVALLTSKSKVALLQCQSIPRLELCGARMAA